jgi:hypothetical protein
MKRYLMLVLMLSGCKSALQKQNAADKRAYEESFKRAYEATCKQSLAYKEAHFKAIKSDGGVTVDCSAPH